MDATGAIQQTPRNESKCSVPVAERVVAAARGVVFATVMLLKLAELALDGEHLTGLFLLSGLALVYVGVSSIQSATGTEDGRLRMPLLVVDALLITGLIETSGGVRNEFYLLYYIPILQAGVRLTLRDAVAAAVLSACLYMFIGLAHSGEGTVVTSIQARTVAFAASSIAMALVFGLLTRDMRARVVWHENVTELGAAICMGVGPVAEDLEAPAGLEEFIGAEGAFVDSLSISPSAPRAVLQSIAVALGAEHQFLAVHHGDDRPPGWTSIEPVQSGCGSQVAQDLAVELVDRHLTQGQAFVLPDLREEPALQRHAGGIRTALVLPLKRGERTVATVVLCDKERTACSPGEQFDLADLRLASALAPQAALLLDYAHVHRRLQTVLYQSVGAMAAAVDAKDPDTRGHADRVAVYAAFLAEAMGLPPRVVEALRLAAILHDIGKIGLDERVLQGTESLDAEQWRLIRKHPRTGERIFAHLDDLAFVLPALRSHHERFDGTGYPDGIAGRDIPIIARLISIADAFDAMTYRRPYRQDPLSVAEACAELSREAGTQFDPALVGVFVKHAHERLVKDAIACPREALEPEESVAG